MKLRIVLSMCLVWMVAKPSMAQDIDELFAINTPATVNLEISSDEELEPDIGKKKKKKRKRNTFWGDKNEEGIYSGRLPKCDNVRTFLLS